MQNIRYSIANASAFGLFVQLKRAIVGSPDAGSQSDVHAAAHAGRRAGRTRSAAELDFNEHWLTTVSL
jgi:hypothetical protein